MSVSNRSEKLLEGEAVKRFIYKRYPSGWSLRDNLIIET